MQIKSCVMLIALLMTGCGVIRDTPKYTFADGYYRSTVFGKEKSRVYVDNAEDSVVVNQVTKGPQGERSIGNRRAFPQERSDSSISTHNFRQMSFDLDFLTIPFKYRPRSGSLPQQFNTNLNGVIYLGFRSDLYRVRYKA